jgi:N-acetylmuramoyl-L-alanine amidase
MNYLVILDAGHGLDTSGKRTPLFSDGSFMRENEFNRSVVRKIDAILEQFENIDVVFTTTEKREIGLQERVIRVNDLYDKVKSLYDKIVLVSVHANALNGSWGTQNGTSTYHYPGNQVDKEFATVINNNLIAKTKLFNRGVLEGNFQIVREVKMPACLCECAFMDNLTEAKLLLTDEFRQACAEGIKSGLIEYFGMNKQIVNVEYSATTNGTYQLKGYVEDFGVKIVNKKNTAIEEPFCTNGTFFWNDTLGAKYSTSILYADGVIYQNYANHLPCAQNVFIVFKDGRVKMMKLRNLSELNLDTVRIAIGGIGLRNTQDATFKYDPAAEGFAGAFSDVLRRTNKTVIGYNVKENKICLMCRKNIIHSGTLYDLLELVKDCEFDIALSVDGGGSSFMNNADEMVLNGDGRVIHNIIGFGL